MLECRSIAQSMSDESLAWKLSQGNDLPVLALSLLGPLAITLDGHPFDELRIRPAIALCVYLTCQPERHRRERLMGLLWPDWPQTSAQQNLRQTVYTLRQALPEVASRDGKGPVSLVLAERETIQANPDAGVSVDVHRFTSLLHLSTPEALLEATDLYRGDFLADFFLPDSNPFEEWAAARREAFRRQALGALERLADVALEKADFVAAEGYARRQLDIDNLREKAHRQLLLALARSGQRTTSIAHYEAYTHLLKEELGVTPSADIRALSERIASGMEAPAARATTPGRAAPKHNLPAQMTPFLGREEQIAEITGLIEKPHTRLVTLTGVGGTGKTRLALESAGRVLDKFIDGAVFVPLETILDPAQILTELMQALGVSERLGATATDAVKVHLRDRQLLLVLDNFEQIVDGAPIIGDLLRAAPRVKALVTSREELRLYGEHIVSIPPMALPPVGARTATELSENESVQLFVQRARSVRRDFQLTDDNATDVAAICRELDGLPLALELAAGQVKRLAPAQLRQRLGSRLSLLASDLRDLNSRQRTLRGTIDWSYNLLSPEDRSLFARLGIFAGGWTPAAAEAIVGGETIPYVLAGLESLAEKNLIRVRPDENGDSRYAMLETIREYAVEKLQESGETDRFAGKHLDYFFALRQSIEPGGGAIKQLRALWDVEQANYLAAMEWGSRQPDISKAVRLAATTSLVWEAHGWYREALDIALRFTFLPGIVEPPWIASSIRYQAAGKAIFLGEYGLARDLLRAALDFDRAGHEPGDEAHTLMVLGRVDVEEGHYAAGLEIFEQAWQLADGLGIDLEDGIFAWYSEALLGLDRPDEAAEVLSPMMSLPGIPRDSGLVWPRLAELELLRGRFEQARATLRHGHEPVRSRVRIWRNLLIGVTGWLLERPESQPGDARTATLLLGANHALAEHTGDRLSAFYQGLVERRVVAARERLATEEFRFAWEEGLGYSEDEADRLLLKALDGQLP